MHAGHSSSSLMKASHAAYALSAAAAAAAPPDPSATTAAVAVTLARWALTSKQLPQWKIIQISSTPGSQPATRGGALDEGGRMRRGLKRRDSLLAEHRGDDGEEHDQHRDEGGDVPERGSWRLLENVCEQLALIDACAEQHAAKVGGGGA